MQNSTSFAPLLISALLAACGGVPPVDEGLERRSDELTPEEQHGELLFNTATFGGNGRTCSTCHPMGGVEPTGTVNPQEAQARFAADPNDTLFRSIESDDGQGTSFTRLLNHATIRIHIPLPPCVTIEEEPGATEVVLNRGIPTTLNTPALDTFLMYDGREPDLQSQALGAVHAHTENTIEPTASELDDIAAFQKTSAFFSSAELEAFAAGGAAPVLPAGTTAAEIHGRAIFDRTCLLCHGGPMLKDGGSKGDKHFFDIRVSAENVLGNPVRTFIFPSKLSKKVPLVCPTPDPRRDIRVVSPDPGRALITGKPEDADTFKINPLWGIKMTAPYFHDNSSKTLEEMVAHYSRNLPIVFDTLNINVPPLTPEEEPDLVAFLLLL